MKKKLSYIFLITLILVLPIIYWLNFKWGIKFSAIDIKKLRFAFMRDKFLFFATLCNSGLYVFVVYKIINSNVVENNGNNNTKIPEKQINTVPNAIMLSASTGSGQINPNDKKWQDMYKGNGEDGEVVVKEAPQAPIAKENISKPEDNKIITEEIPQPQQPVLEENQDNIINIPPLEPEDVINVQVERALAEIGYENMGDIYINGVYVDFVSIAESDTLVIGKINAKGGNIIANETPTTPNTPPSWFTNEEKYPSPVWEVKNASNEFVKMINEVLPEDNGIIVKSVVVIPSATVVNQDDIEPKWKELDVDVVKLSGKSNLPNIVSVLPDKKDTEVLESYKKFVQTLMKYFSQKYKRPNIKKAG